MRYLSYVFASIAALAAGCAKGSSGSPDAEGDDDPIPDARIVDGSVDIDGNPLIPDAEIPDAEIPPDAEIIPPDASCSTTTQQLLLNGNFDSAPLGVSWTQLPQDPGFPPITTGQEIEDLTGVIEHSSPNAVWLGGLLSSSDRLYGRFLVPANTISLQISGFKWHATAETTSGFDIAFVEIMSTADIRLELLEQFSPTSSDGAWMPLAYTPTGNYAGQTIGLQLRSTTDSSLNTNFFFDSFTVTATVEVCL